MSDTNEASSRPVHGSYDSARAYGNAMLQSGFAFARAGARCVGAVLGAGVETVAAFDAARRATHGAADEQSFS